MQFEDLLYELRNGVAWITINRPEKMNAFRGTTCEELIKALNLAGYDKSVARSCSRRRRSCLLHRRRPVGARRPPEESKEGVAALKEKRKPDFRKFAK